MEPFPIHTIDSAPSGSTEIVEAAIGRYGFTPNLVGVMADSPAMARAYWAIGQTFSEHTSLDPLEQQIVLLAVSRIHACHYCMAAHSGAAAAAGLPENELEVLREGRPLSDARLEALRRLAEEIVSRRGEPSEDVVRDFMDAGFERRAILDVVVGVAYKTLSNFTNHIAEMPLDPAFARWEWDAGDRVVLQGR